MKHENRKECSLGIACVDQPSRWDSVSSFTIITDIKVDSLLARFTPFREEHSRHQVAVTTPSCVGPPVIKQEQTIIHRRELGFPVRQIGAPLRPLIVALWKRRTHHSNGRRRKRIDFRTRHIHCTILWAVVPGFDCKGSVNALRLNEVKARCPLTMEGSMEFSLSCG